MVVEALEAAFPAIEPLDNVRTACVRGDSLQSKAHPEEHGHCKGVAKGAPWPSVELELVSNETPHIEHLHAAGLRSNLMRNSSGWCLLTVSSECRSWNLSHRSLSGSATLTRACPQTRKATSAVPSQTLSSLSMAWLVVMMQLSSAGLVSGAPRLASSMESGGGGLPRGSGGGGGGCGANGLFGDWRFRAVDGLKRGGE